jgi:hypothetical protein
MAESSSVLPEVMVWPARNEMCIAEIGFDQTGKAKVCPCKARMVVNGKPLCTTHSERAMESYCGRKVSLPR